MSVLYLDISALTTSGFWLWHSTYQWDTYVYCVKFSFCLWPHEHLGSYQLLSSHIINTTQSSVLFSSCSLDTFWSEEFILQFHFGIVSIMNVYLVSLTEYWSGLSFPFIQDHIYIPLYLPLYIYSSHYNSFIVIILER